MGFSDWAWLALGAYMIHILEEYFLDWRNWARSVIKLPVSWIDFGVTNAAVIVLGIVQAELADSLPFLALAYAALLLINATLFHVAPIIWTGGRFSPGAITAVLLFYPTSIGTFWAAATMGELTAGKFWFALGAGAVLMAFPIVLIRLRGLRYFVQPE